MDNEFQCKYDVSTLQSYKCQWNNPFIYHQIVFWFEMVKWHWYLIQWVLCFFNKLFFFIIIFLILELTQKIEHTINIMPLSIIEAYINDGWMNLWMKALERNWMLWSRQQMNATSFKDQITNNQWLLKSYEIYLLDARRTNDAHLWLHNIFKQLPHHLLGGALETWGKFSYNVKVDIGWVKVSLTKLLS